jgi:hypothetical protein
VKELACAGKVSLRSVKKLRTGRSHKKRRVKLGSGRFKAIPAGARRKVRVKISHAGLALLRSHGKIRATATVSTKNTGGRKLQRTRTLTLKLAG